jgi:hypothetical protein
VQRTETIVSKIVPHGEGRFPHGARHSLVHWTLV